MSRQLGPHLGPRGITVLGLVLLILAIVVAVVLISRYVAV